LYFVTYALANEFGIIGDPVGDFSGAKTVKECHVLAEDCFEVESVLSE
jgi:hypothetical protein